jgi:hypothetical protein
VKSTWISDAPEGKRLHSFLPFFLKSHGHLSPPVARRIPARVSAGRVFVQDLGALVTREARERPSSMHPDVVLALQGQDGNRNAVSRQGGSRLAPRAPPTRLVVDVREFMSSLPAVLYQQGLNLVPLTLEVSFSGLIWRLLNF